MIVMIDNYDSFTFNVVQLFEKVSGQRIEVVRNDAFDPDTLLQSRPRAIIVSPGPGVPSAAGRTVELIRADRDVPLLGVCLGHQAIGEAFGGKVGRAPLPVHGKRSVVRHSGRRLFEGCPAELQVTRYHSLVVDRETLPAELEIDAESDDGLIMALSHRDRPIFGVQFHPESYGSSHGELLAANFLELTGDAP
jgi:anthranilate synthase component 2